MFKIVKDTNPQLREKCKEVENPRDPSIISLLKEMVDYLKKSQDDEYALKHNLRAGVGLAAPQIGINKRMLAVYYSIDEKNTVAYGLVNPRIVSTSARECYLSNGEGCLSVDEDHKGYVYRFYKVIIKAFDAISNSDVTITARGYDAIVLQHEMDHLDGILYYDRINKFNPFIKKPNSVEI